MSVDVFAAVLFMVGLVAQVGIYFIWREERRYRSEATEYAALFVPFVALLPWSYRQERRDEVTNRLSVVAVCYAVVLLVALGSL